MCEPLWPLKYAQSREIRPKVFHIDTLSGPDVALIFYVLVSVELCTNIMRVYGRLRIKNLCTQCDINV